jgi:hypothetical protein
VADRYVKEILTSLPSGTSRIEALSSRLAHLVPNRADTVPQNTARWPTRICTTALGPVASSALSKAGLPCPTLDPTRAPSASSPTSAR